jgi:hypothetical protein
MERFISTIERKIFSRTKYENLLGYYTNDYLQKIFLYILYKDHEDKLLSRSFAVNNLSYINKSNEFMLDIFGEKQREYIKTILCGFNRIPVIEEYTGEIINHDFEYTNDIRKLLNETPNKCVDLIALDEYRNNIKETKILLETLSNELLKTISDKDKDEIKYEDNILDIKDYKLHIIERMNDHVNKLYRNVCYLNKPELMIYNILVRFKEKCGGIQYIFYNFSLPVSRENKERGCLRADFLILFKVNEKLRISIIEHDGPTHYNKNYYLFKKDVVQCDIVKNNFCKINGIDILRIRDYDDDIESTIIQFIFAVLYSDNYVFEIPEYEEYMKLLE